MILKCDAKQLEWRSYIEWSDDPVGKSEILNNDDIHANNQAIFKLPSRLISKIFLFRWIYRGSAYAYANDANFMGTSSSTNFWQDVIDKANEKYNTLYNFQNDLIHQVEQGNPLVIPSGRSFDFEMQLGKLGDWYWNIRDIVNWPNQGYSADLMVIARISLRNRIKQSEAYKKKEVLLDQGVIKRTFF